MSEKHPGTSPPRVVLGEGNYARLVQERNWEFVERTNITGIVVLIPVTAEGEIVLVEQYRPAVAAQVIELPAGLVGDEDPDEAMAAAAKRELEEETGYSADKLEWLFQAPPSAGLVAEQPHFYRATGLSKVGPGGGVDGENITVHVQPLNTVNQWLDEQRDKGIVIEAKVYAGLYLASS